MIHDANDLGIQVEGSHNVVVHVQVEVVAHDPDDVHSVHKVLVVEEEHDVQPVLEKEEDNDVQVVLGVEDLDALVVQEGMEEDHDDGVAFLVRDGLPSLYQDYGVHGHGHGGKEGT